MIHKLNWSQTWDDDDNSIWEAAGPYGDEDGGCIAYWRLVHKLVNDQPVWIAEHDAELEGTEDGDGQWLNLSAAKSDILKIHNEIIESELLLDQEKDASSHSNI